MNRHRSSSLKYFTKNCPAALGFLESNAPADRAIFQTGIAAHACLQVCTERAVEAGRELTEAETQAACEDTAKELMAHGRAFDGIPEPPMPPDDAVEGRDIALNWLDQHPASPHARAEKGLAMLADGIACDYADENARYIAILDEIEGPLEIEDEEGFEGSRIVITDFKTAWTTNESELDTIQFRGQAVLTALHYPEVTEIEQVAANLRTGQRYTRTLYPQGEPELLEQWRKDIFALCDAADETRAARPGYNCMGCPYSPICEDSYARMLGENDPVAKYVMAEALRGEYAKIAQAACKESFIRVGDHLVGYHAKEQNTPTDNAAHQLLFQWFNLHEDERQDWLAENSMIVSLIAGIGLTGSNINAAAKSTYPGRGTRELREEFVEPLLTTKVVKRFGVQKVSA